MASWTSCAALQAPWAQPRPLWGVHKRAGAHGGAAVTTVSRRPPAPALLCAGALFAALTADRGCPFLILTHNSSHPNSPATTDCSRPATAAAAAGGATLGRTTQKLSLKVLGWMAAWRLQLPRKRPLRSSVLTAQWCAWEGRSATRCRQRSGGGRGGAARSTRCHCLRSRCVGLGLRVWVFAVCYAVSMRGCMCGVDDIGAG